MTPGGFYMVYDTGHWTQDNLVRARIAELIPAGEAIDLLVLSHSDSDHLAATDEIFRLYAVRTLLRTGLWRSTGSWGDADSAISAARQAGTTAVFNLRHNAIEPGTGFQLGDATVTFLSGYHWPRHYGEIFDPNGDCTDLSKCRNAGSIVLRLEYAERSILFTGDAVGREDHAQADAAPIATEAELIGRQGAFPIDSDVLIAPHHGADNASSTAFIQAVSPNWVIFPSGHDHLHPRQSTAERFLAAGVPLERILRTDLGDNEGDGSRPNTETDDEWDQGATTSADPAGDDDIDIVIQADGTLTVGYRNAPAGNGGTDGVVTPNPDGGACVDRAACCRVCRTSRACGDSCISASHSCNQPHGCACDLADVCP